MENDPDRETNFKESEHTPLRDIDRTSSRDYNSIISRDMNPSPSIDSDPNTRDFDSNPSRNFGNTPPRDTDPTNSIDFDPNVSGEYNRSPSRYSNPTTSRNFDHVNSGDFNFAPPIEFTHNPSRDKDSPTFGLDTGRTSDRHDPMESEDDIDVLAEEMMAPLLSGNHYQMRKMAAQALMDVALMMANISQLRTLLAGGQGEMAYFYFLIVMVCLSIACQLVFAILIFMIWARESDHDRREEYIAALKKVEADNRTQKRTKEEAAERLKRLKLNRKTDFEHGIITNRMNYASMILVFLITVINMFITGFGIKLEGSASDY